MKNTLLILALFLPVLGQAGAFRYDCFSYGDDQKLRMSLAIDGEVAEADIAGELWDSLGGKLDESYRPRAKTSFVRFGHSLYLEKALLKGGKLLKDDSLGGFAEVRGEAEGGFLRIKFVCKRAN